MIVSASGELRVAMLGMDVAEWGGGLELLRIIANALAVRKTLPHVRLIFLMPERSLIFRLKRMASPYKRMLQELLAFQRPQFFRPDLLTHSQVLDVVSSIDGLLEIVPHKPTRRGILNVLEKIYPDVLLPVSISLGTDFPFPWIGYIPDLQHRYLPEFFSRQECVHRDVIFSALLRDAPAVLVNSRTVKEDLQRFYEPRDCQIFNLPFAPSLKEHWLDTSPDVTRSYDLPKRYFIISNQLWVHKDHPTAFKALAKLHESAEFRDVEIVCTGRTDDFRFPKHFLHLRKLVYSLGLASKVRFLGHISKDDQIGIMRGAIAVLQPTLFEGGPGGGSVYDAVALGKRAIVSDIAVNKEITEGEVEFFRTGLSDDLAWRMARALQEPYEDIQRDQLIQQSLDRVARLGDRLVEAIYCASRVQPVMTAF